MKGRNKEYAIMLKRLNQAKIVKKNYVGFSIWPYDVNMSIY